MTPKPEHYSDLTRLVSGMLDGRLTVEERVRLELLLESDPAARRLYFQMVDQEIELDCLFVGPVLERGPVSSALSEVANRGWARRDWWTLAAAAVVTFFLMLWLQRERPPEQLRAADTSWTPDFKTGSLLGWTGEVVFGGLPPGSAIGIRAVATPAPEGVFYKIAPPENWQRGFVAVTDTSTLHVRYRLGSPTWLNVFLHAIGPDRPEPSMFQLMGSRFPGAAGQWQTASIPFARFQRKVWDNTTGGLAFVGGGPRAGERVASLFFSAPHPIDLVIDRIWITPDGTGVETITPLQ